MKNNVIRTSLIAAGLGLAAVAYAGPPMHGHGGDCGGPPPHGMFHAFDAEHLPPFLKSIKLTDEQRTKIGEILKTQGQALKDRFQAGRGSHDALRKLAFSSDYSEEKAKALSEEGARTMAEAALAHARIDHGIYQVLTPEQQQQVREHLDGWEGHRPPPH